MAYFSLAGSGDPFAESIGMNCAGLVDVLLSLYLITRLGQRTILSLGASSQVVCMLIIGAVHSANPTSVKAYKVVVAVIAIHIFFYTMCSASYLYLATGEIPSNCLRSFTLGIASALGFLGAWLISFTVPYFIHPLDLNWGAKYAWIWFGSNVAYFLFMFFFLPETKDRTLKIDEIFEKKVPARKSKGYVCVETNDARLARLVRRQTKDDKPQTEFRETIEVS